jgi:hypothetical protein
MFSRVNIPDLAFAAFLVALGALALTLAGDLPVGTAASMGPGYVPRALAALIVAYGLALAARAVVAPPEKLPAIVWRPLILIGLATALFAVLLPLAGLAVTSFVVVLGAGYAAPDARSLENALLAIGLAVFAVVLFVVALGLPIPIWPP